MKKTPSPQKKDKTIFMYEIFGRVCVCTCLQWFVSAYCSTTTKKWSLLNVFSVHMNTHHQQKKKWKCTFTLTVERCCWGRIGQLDVIAMFSFFLFFLLKTPLTPITPLPIFFLSAFLSLSTFLPKKTSMSLCLNSCPFLPICCILVNFPSQNSFNCFFPNWMNAILTRRTECEKRKTMNNVSRKYEMMKECIIFSSNAFYALFTLVNLSY